MLWALFFPDLSKIRDKICRIRYNQMEWWSLHGFIEGRGGIEMSGSGMTLQHDLKFYPSDKPLAENDYRREKERILRKVSSDPNPDHYLELAQLEYRRGLYEESKKAVEKALQERPDFPEGELFLSKILEKMDREAEAEQAFLRLMERHPSYSCAYREYARFLLEKKEQTHRAECLLLRGLELNPQDGLAHALLAEIYAQTGRERQAVLHLRIASRRDGDTYLHQSCGKVFFQMGKYSEAAEQFRLALMADPRNKTARSQLKLVLKLQRKGILSLAKIPWLRRSNPAGER